MLADSLAFHGPDGPMPADEAPAGNPDGMHWGWQAHRRVGHALADLVGELLPDAPVDH